MATRKQRENHDLFIDNQLIYWFYRDRLEQVALSQFDYKNWPKSCDRWFFEWKALHTGQACFCVPKGGNELLSLGFVPYLTNEQYERTTIYNVYGYPVGIKGIGWCEGDIINGHQIKGAGYEVETEDFVVMYDNMGRMSLDLYIDLYARRLWECHMTIRSNEKFQNIPYMVRGKDANEMELTIENFFMDLWNFKPYVTIPKDKSKDDEKNFGDLDISTLDLRVEYKVLDMWKALKLTWAEALSMLGITTQYSKKSQYENQDELYMDKMADDLSLANRMMRRVEFCNRVNDRWGGTPLLEGDLEVNLAPTQDWYQKGTFPMDMVVNDIANLKSSTSTFL